MEKENCEEVASPASAAATPKSFECLLNYFLLIVQNYLSSLTEAESSVAAVRI